MHKINNVKSVSSANQSPHVFSKLTTTSSIPIKIPDLMVVVSSDRFLSSPFNPWNISQTAHFSVLQRVFFEVHACCSSVNSTLLRKDLLSLGQDQCKLPLMTQYSYT